MPSALLLPEQAASRVPKINNTTTGPMGLLPDQKRKRNLLGQIRTQSWHSGVLTPQWNFEPNLNNALAPCRGPKRDDRISLGGGAIRPNAGD
jgi:hypothetical protein